MGVGTAGAGFSPSGAGFSVSGAGVGADFGASGAGAGVAAMVFSSETIVFAPCVTRDPTPFPTPIRV